jgi:(E)-4-hydroxy-3-methylbut-2-enyl-diphosphate synthase
MDEFAYIPVMLWFSYAATAGESEDNTVVKASADFGSLFVDGLGEGILWDADSMHFDALREASFNLLQASRMRISKTEFISCPSCGRTLFNLQETTKKNPRSYRASARCSDCRYGVYC